MYSLGQLFQLIRQTIPTQGFLHLRFFPLILEHDVLIQGKGKQLVVLEDRTKQRQILAIVILPDIHPV